MPLYVYDCIVCGKKQTSERKDARYCSAACKMIDYRKKKKAIEEQKANTLDLWTQATVNQVLVDAPHMEETLLDYFSEHGKEQFCAMIEVLDTYRKVVLAIRDKS